MDFETRLKYLDVMYQSNEMQYSLEIKKEIDYYSLFYVELKILLEKYLGRKDVAKEDVRVFIDNIDIILKYTNNSNMAWIYYDCLYEEEDFIKCLIDNICNMRFKHHVCSLVGSICKILEHRNGYDEFLCDEMLENLASLDVPFKNSFYNLIWEKLDGERKFKFIQSMYKKKKRINFTNLGPDVLSYDIVNYIKKNALGFAINSTNIFALRDLLVDEPNILKEFDDYFEQHKDLLSQLIVDSLGLCDYDDTIKEIMYFIVWDVVKNEDALLSDIKWRTGGSYSNLICIKDKIIKYGSERATPKFPNNPYFPKPLLRRQLISEAKSLFVEVVELELTDTISENQMYELYKNFRKLNIAWRDVKKENVGILKKDNRIYWKSNLKPNSKSLELSSYRGRKQPLKAGSVVLLDADDLYDLNNEEISHSKSRYLDDVFEARYQEEMKMVKKK